MSRAYIDPSLFALISRAGRASLDELRARTFENDHTLASNVASMVVSGAVTVALTQAPGQKADQRLTDLENALTSGTSGTRGAAPVEPIQRALENILQNTDSAQSVTAIPTSKGFKLSL